IPPCNINGNSIVVGPNPVATDLSIKVTQLNAAKLQFVLHNSAGQNVYTQTVSQAANTFMEYNIPFNRLSRGIYFVSVFKNDKKILSKKILY
ncbi:MAG: T9SS type A sorting domain-containing protein, partial [Ferruginibacter sp.]|nr:T9SS type A sorting domain-containing protein [Ferruginibacter sp.]